MRGSQTASALRTARVIAVAVAVSFTPKTRSWMPQPKSGRITRSPGDVLRIVQIDWRTRVVAVGRQPRRRRASSTSDRERPPAAEEPVAAVRSPDQHGADRDDLAGREVGRVVAGECGVAVRAAGLLLIITLWLPDWTVPLPVGGF